MHIYIYVICVCVSTIYNIQYTVITFLPGCNELRRRQEMERWDPPGSIESAESFSLNLGWMCQQDLVAKFKPEKKSLAHANYIYIHIRIRI